MEAIDKTKIYLDLSKLSEGEIKKLIVLTEGYVSKISDFPILFWDESEWNQAVKGDKLHLGNLTELTYPEFIKLFEGGEENNGWIKIESEDDLPDEETLCWVFRNDRKEVEQLKMPRKGSRTVWWTKTATHYQPIVKPESPKF